MHITTQLLNGIGQLATWHNVPVDPAAWRLIIRAAFALVRR